MRRALIIVLAALATVLGAAPGIGQTRVALVIGNGSYRNVPALPNPSNDATDVVASLERLHFTVRKVLNGTSEDMRRALRDFAPLARRAEIALVYYSGHGMEIGGENWLIPVDAELKEDTAAEYEAVSLRSIMPVVGTASRLGLVILDACRNNPFLARMQRSLPVRAVERGLARVEPTGSVLVAYAAKDGTTALDGVDRNARNSPFTAALLANIETPGLEISFVFRKVHDQVLAATERRQEPFTYGALSGAELFLKPGAPPTNVAVTFPSLAVQVAAFEKFFRASLAEEMKKGRSGDKIEFKVLVRDDLNDDSYLDFIVLNTSSGSCGSGGCGTEVYLADRKGGYSSVLDLFGYTTPHVSAHKTAGFKDVLAVKFTVDNQPVWAIHQWKGNEYEFAFSQFCGRVALEYCTEDSGTFIDPIPDDLEYSTKPGAKLFDSPGGRALNEKLFAPPEIVGKVRGQDWYLARIWKDRAGFISGNYVSKSKAR